MKVRIGENEFKTYRDAKKFVTDTIEQYIGRDIDESSGHFEFFNALWHRSPSYIENASHFQVGRKFRGATICAVTTGGLFIEFSLRSAVSGKFANRWSQLTLAMRQAVRPQVIKFKNQTNGLCSSCGSGGRSEVDHVVSFKQLMREYLDIAGGYPELYTYTHSGWLFRPGDRDFEVGWQKYHQEHCSLRILCVGCHARCTLEARTGRPMVQYFESSGSEDEAMIRQMREASIELQSC